MNPPMINSTSSVSTTKRKREAERSVNWTVEETQVLLCAWSDERIQQSLAENLRNRHVFKHLSSRMSEMGFSRSPHQCRLRVKTLKANYARAKLQRSVDGSQPCTFRYFPEMDAVLGRRSAGGDGGGQQYFVSPERMAAAAPDIHSNTEVGERRLGSLRAGRRCPSSSEETGGHLSWQLDSEVKLEDGEDSTDEYEFSNSGFPQRHHNIYLESSIRREMTGALVENCLSPPSLHVVPPPAAPPSPPLTQPAASPLPAAPPDPTPNTPPASAPRHPESSCLKHLSEGFQRLAADTRGLLLQLESQRQEQARWHQDLLAQWLQREERRQSEAAEREERREKARMEHEIKVLELLTGLAREHRCQCGGGQAVTEAPAGPNHSLEKGGS
ncbi:uncharacterized protein LOC117736168 [Cyclopterus lumpus]|uniref:Myb/SANT-like DNA-binding domain-containing protein n=1 Tax=Cyclopterus lumpus TaxID=8103 RepID=A0A8C2XMP1_CYCLU|nr:uncharacterized protein LOC117736168 [Cyclopterus lumpus]